MTLAVFEKLKGEREESLFPRTNFIVTDFMENSGNLNKIYNFRLQSICNAFPVFQQMFTISKHQKEMTDQAVDATDKERPV